MPLVPLSKSPAGGRGVAGAVGDAPRQALLSGPRSGAGKGSAAEEEGWTGEVGGTFRPDTFAFAMDNPLPPGSGARAAATAVAGAAAYSPPPPPYPGHTAAGAPSSGARREAADPFSSPDPFATAPTVPRAARGSPGSAGVGAGEGGRDWAWMDGDASGVAPSGGSGGSGGPAGGRGGNKRFAGSDEGLI